MSKEMILMIEAVANEKSVDKEIIFDAMEQALAMATRKKHPGEQDFRVAINRKTGDYDTFRCWTVIDGDQELENADAQITLTQARQEDKHLNIGDIIETPVPSIEFGRISAQAAKQVITQKVREAERENMVKVYESKIGTLISGQVKRVTREVIIVDLGNHAEAVMPRSVTISREIFRVSDRIRGYLKEIRRDSRGPQLIMSRACPELVRELFRLEVPEIAEDVIEIKSAARDPGSRAKIAVKTNDGRIDPVGACVGMRGSRVQAVTNELNGERVDIVSWDDHPAQFVINAMSPAEVVSIVIDEDSHTMDIAVNEDQLSQAIGRNGQNVKLASQLTGWRLNVMSENEAMEKQENELNQQLQRFVAHLEIDQTLAASLLEEGFTSVEEIAYVPREEMLNIEGIDENLADELRERAKNALLTLALSGEEIGPNRPTYALLNMEGITRMIAHRLAEIGVTTPDELAEQSVDELVEVEGIDAVKAAELIMIARKPWFEDDEQTV